MALRFIVLVLSVLLAPAAASAQASRERVAELLAQVASAPAQTSPVPPADTVDLTVDEAVARALERNLDIAVERLNPQVFDLFIAQTRGAYKPVLTSVFGERSQVNLPTSQLNGGQRVQNDTVTYNTGVAQDLPWGGGSFAINWNNARADTTNTFANFNPSYTSNVQFAFNQPLLRNFRIDATRQQLIINRINREVSEVQLRATITNTVANVRQAYWDLVFAVDAIQVARGSLELAEKLVQDNQARVDVGAMAPIDVVQAQAEAATRRYTLAQAETSWRTAELALKRLIVDGTDDALWRAALRPSDRPTLAGEPVDIEAALGKALDARTDLIEARRDVEANDVSVRYLRNQTLPSIDVVATYGLQGLGGTQFIRQGSGLGSTVVGTVPGGFRDAISALLDRDFPTWNVSLNVSYPIGQSAAEAQLARARLQMQQSQAEIRALELRVATEVTNAGLLVQSSLRRVEAATAARELAERRLEAEQSKFEVGMSTNFFVVQAQRDLADAQNAELRALLDYRKSLVNFERVQETSLSGAGITVVSSGGGGGAAGGAGGAGRSGGTQGGGQGGGFQP